MKKITLTHICLTILVSTFGQSLKERLILTDTKDSTFLNASSIYFDNFGNYCFEIKKKGKEYFYTNKDTFGGFRFIGGTYGSTGSINYTKDDSDDKNLPYYFKNAHGTKIYGKIKGKIERFIDSGTKENMAITVSYKDSAYYYINNKLVSQIHKNKADDLSYYDWCAFSENGNSIYYLKKDSIYVIYVNGTQIGTSNSNYYELSINNNEQYIFGEGKKPKVKVGKYDFMFYTHAIDTILGPVRTVWYRDLKENGSYYYSGDDNGTDYIVINNKIHKNLKNISNIILKDKTNYLFNYTEDGITKINVNGNVFSHTFQKIYHPSLDNEGNFAFYGFKDYFLYKYVNGKPLTEPITGYGVRPNPLYISPKGQSLHYFKTDDSTYLYQDDKLLFTPIKNSKNFKVIAENDIISHYFTKGKVDNGNNLFYIEIDSVGFWVYNGEFSKPMMPAKESSYYKTAQLREIVASQSNEHGFFIIQKIDSDKFIININNKIYKEIESVNQIIKNNCFFDGKALVFYGIKGLSFYQYTLQQ